VVGNTAVAATLVDITESGAGVGVISKS